MRKLVRDGVALAYEETGSGAPPLLLVHGWTCDHTFFAPQFEHFGRRHRVVAVDLRGHGESDKPRQEYTMSGFADDLAWLCGDLGVEGPVIIGHSMGGVIALELAARRPHLPIALVLLDAPVVTAPAFDEHVRPVRERLLGSDYREAMRRIAADMFLPTDDQRNKVRIVERMALTPQHVIVSAFDGMDACDSAAAAAACRVPILNVASAGGHMPDLQRFGQLCPQLVNGQTVGAGHFHQLEVPDQVNAMIERFLAISLPSVCRPA
jgi:pimeloyl-ACP methyl ester carboxylesterase